MLGYGVFLVVMVFFLNERKVIEDLMSFFKYIDDKGEFKDFLENES